MSDIAANKILQVHVSVLITGLQKYQTKGKTKKHKLELSLIVIRISLMSTCDKSDKAKHINPWDDMKTVEEVWETNFLYIYAILN